MNDYKFGNFIYNLRAEKGLTQADVAQRLGVTPAAVSKWENGSTKPRYEMLLRLAEILEVSTEELINGEKTDREQLDEQTSPQEHLKKKNPIWIVAIIAVLIVAFCVFVIFMFKNPDPVSDGSSVDAVTSAEQSSQTSSESSVSSNTSSKKQSSSKTSSKTDSTVLKVEEVNTVGNVNGNGQGYSVVVKQGNWIYYCHMANLRNLMRMSPDGAKRQALFEGYIHSINIVGEWVYYIEANPTGEEKKGIYKSKINGSGKTLLAEGVFCYLFVSDDGWIYYTGGNVMVGGNLYRVKTDGTKQQKLCNDICKSINIVGDKIYYIVPGDGIVYQMNTDGSKAQVFFPAITAQAVVVEGNTLYTCDGKAFQQINLDGTGYKSYTLEDVKYFTVNGGWLYYVKSESEITTYYKASLDLSEIVELVTVSGPYDSIYMCVVDDWLYFPNGEDRGKMYRVKTDGSGEVEFVG